MKSSLKNMVVTLLLITLVSATALGFVYGLTKDPIEEAKSAKTTGALSMVLPKFDNDPASDTTTVHLDGFPVKVYTAKMGGAPVGYAVETATGMGFSGLIKMMVGFRADGQVENIEVLEHNETPGLGSKMADPDNVLLLSFKGKNAADIDMRVTKDGGQVDAITASTISSRAYADAVKRAYNAYQTVALGAEVPQQEVLAPLERVLPTHERNEATDLTVGDKTLYGYTAFNGDTPVGYAVQSSASGYKGPIELIVGFEKDGTIRAIVVTEQSETPGFGSVIEDEGNALEAAFKGKKPGELKMALTEDGGDIDAITGSTVTSKAYVKAVAAACAGLEILIKEE